MKANVPTGCKLVLKKKMLKISMEEKERKSYLMLIDTYLIFNVLIKRYKYKNVKKHNYVIIYIDFNDTMIKHIIFL